MNKSKKRYFGHLLGVLACFVGLAVFILVERSGVQYHADTYKDPYLPAEKDYNWKDAGEEKKCLLIMDSAQADSTNALEQMNQILEDMRVAYEVCDLESSPFPSLSSYETAVVLISDLEVMGEPVLDLCDWVKQGGRVMFALPFQVGTEFQMIASKMGIIEADSRTIMVSSILPNRDFMIGGGISFPIMDAYTAALTVKTGNNCTIYAEEPNNHTPLIWACDYGEGRFVVDNIGYMEKAFRGFYAASYSLLEDICVYPVINGSSFYIDDFPSPVPQGDGTYIKRDYGMSISDFYSNVWWPDMMKLAKKHRMVYTGMIIENYEDQTAGELVRNRDLSRYQFFGNMLLDTGGELGFHGYNHQPLCLDNFEYAVDLGYNTWESAEEMEKSITELENFSKGVFPEEKFPVYVPPSNILSEEGRTLLSENFPDIRTIASIYFPGDSAYEQEFEVAEDGMVETPRVISGCDIDAYMRIAALSELNFHFVNSHFLHPDDLLDKDRGAAEGWKTLKTKFSSYLDWLYEAAPDIRNLTGSKMAGAVERFCAVSVWKLAEPETLYITVDGLTDEAYLMLRVNEGELGAVKGGTLTRLTKELYLLHAEEPEIEIERNR